MCARASPTWAFLVLTAPQQRADQVHSASYTRPCADARTASPSLPASPVDSSSPYAIPLSKRPRMSRPRPSGSRTAPLSLNLTRALPPSIRPLPVCVNPPCSVADAGGYDESHRVDRLATRRSLITSNSLAFRALIVCTTASLLLNRPNSRPLKTMRTAFELSSRCGIVIIYAGSRTTTKRRTAQARYGLDLQKRDKLVFLCSSPFSSSGTAHSYPLSLYSINA